MNTKYASFKEQYKNFSQKLSTYVRLDKTKSTARKVINSLWAALFGLLIALIFIGISSKNNPFLFFAQIEKAFINQTNTAKFLTYFVIFGFSGLASAVGFKSGLFNIGISGQMMISSTLMYSLFIGLNVHDITPALLVVGLLLSIIGAAIMGAIAGLLKAYLNVHEVISTILMNWIVAKLNGFLFVFQNSPFGDKAAGEFFDNLGGSGIKAGTFRIVGGTNQMQLIFSISFIVIFVVLSIVLFLVYKSTTMGYKLKMLGLSKSNGEYIGINEKLTTVYVMIFSAALAGLAGFFYYVFDQNLYGAKDTAPIAIGFESIAIALLALNSSIGVIIVSFFYGILYTIRTSLQAAPLYIKPDEIPIITSIVLYFAAIAQMFMNFKPINFSFISSVKLGSRKYWVLRKIYLAKKKHLKLTTKYSKLKALIEQNIKLANWEKMINKYREDKVKYFYLLLEQESKINYYQNKLKLVERLQQHKANLYFDNLTIKNAIKHLKDPKTLTAKSNPFATEELIKMQEELDSINQKLTLKENLTRSFEEKLNAKYNELKTSLRNRMKKLNKLAALENSENSSINFGQIDRQIEEINSKIQALLEINPYIDTTNEFFNEEIASLHIQLNDEEIDKDSKEYSNLQKLLNKKFIKAQKEANKILDEKLISLREQRKLKIDNYDVITFEYIAEQKEIVSEQLTELNSKVLLIDPNSKFANAELINLSLELENIEVNYEKLEELKNNISQLIKETYEAKSEEINLQIKELNDKILANKQLFTEYRKNYKEVELAKIQQIYLIESESNKSQRITSFDIKQFNRMKESRKEQIKVLNKAYKKQQNALLAMNRKDSTNDEVLKIFDDYSNYKKLHIQNLNSLNSNYKKTIRMNYQSEITSIKYEYRTAVNENNKFVIDNYILELISKNAKSKEVR
ncbi:ABC transporter permease subunit [Mycoplasmopsis meleagridis]|uniref:ABC transporter permease subunit n=1 Tax=Mycoplasmopsis meleagridis TaxID=29561 RepID=UPI00073D7949|nr:hypothetical protein [Mycoplasmopsis meleagridis]KUH47254.1 hypothetical protein ASB56_02440 [Mycoplasmopsis meleagridis]